MEIKVKITVSTRMGLSCESANEVSVLPVHFFFYGLCFPPLLPVSTLERKWVERNQNTCKTKPKTKQNLISSLNSETQC